MGIEPRPFLPALIIELCEERDGRYDADAAEPSER